MPRTITAAAATELAKASFWVLHVVEIQWQGSLGTKRYASSDYTVGDDGVDTDGKLIAVGPVTISLNPQAAGHANEVEVQIEDNDRAIFDAIRTTTPQLKRAMVYRFPRGLTFGTDEIPMLDGIVWGQPTWSGGILSLTLRDVGHLHRQEIGQVVDRENFPHSKEADDFV